MESKRHDIMKKLSIFLTLFLSGHVSLWAQEGFISDYEYGEMLYANPRGVSCAQCHGKMGEGTTIVEYRDIHGKQILKGSDIRLESLTSMISSVNTYHKVMPRYYLTNEEVKAIYEYLKVKNHHYLAKFEENNTTK